jgi:hypothetical protein
VRVHEHGHDRRHHHHVLLVADRRQRRHGLDDPAVAGGLSLTPLTWFLQREDENLPSVHVGCREWDVRILL